MLKMAPMTALASLAHRPSFFLGGIGQALAVVALLSLAACGSPEDRAKEFYARGMSFLEKGEYVRARLELRNAVQAKSDLVPAWWGLAHTEEKTQNWPAYATALRRISELDEKDFESRLRLSRIATAARGFDEALRWINAALEINPQDKSALIFRAAILFRLGDRDGALKQARTVLESDPGNVDATVLLASERFSASDPQAALRMLGALQADKQETVAVLLLKIRIYDSLKDLAEVESHLKRLIALSPSDSGPKRELARFYIAQQRPDSAESLLREIANSNPNQPAAALDVVRYLLAVKGADAAREELTRLAQGPGPTLSYRMALADLYLAQGNFTEAEKVFLGLIAEDLPRDDQMQVRVRFADVLLSRKELEKAEAQIAEILRVDQRHADGLRLRGAVRLEKRQFDDALADLRQALNDQPRSVPVLSLMGRVYERAGSIELADKHFNSATRASNFAPNVGLDYVAFLQRRGLSEHAENILVELASRNPGNVPVLTALARAKLTRQDWIGANEIATALRKQGNRVGIADQIEASILAGQRKVRESLTVLENAHAANPDSVQPLVALVRSYLQAQAPDKAEALLKSVLKANPANAEAMVLLGSIELQRNAPEKALTLFKEAIERQPAKVIGYRALSGFHADRKDFKTAIDITRTGLQQLPRSFELRLVQAGLFEQSGDRESAIAAYEALLRDDPGALVVANNLASLISENASDKATLDRAHSIAAILTGSPLPHFKDTLGWIQYKRGEHKSALALLEEAAAQLPNVAMVHYHLGVTRKALGQAEKGTEDLKRAMELASNDADLRRKVSAALEGLGTN